MDDASAADEAGWIARAQRGDPSAFAALVRLHQQRVFRFILRLTGSREEAMELTQDSFLNAWQALPGWRPRARFATWLLQIARNAALDTLRRRQLVEFAPLDDGLPLSDPAPGPDEVWAARQRGVVLDRALRRLPFEQREVLLLREVEELSYTEIAALIGVAEGTVKSRLARARAALLALLRHTTGERHEG